MAEEIGFENGRNSNFEGLVTLTLDPAIRHTVVHHSTTSTYIPNFIQIEETICGRTDGRTYGHFPPYILDFWKSTLKAWIQLIHRKCPRHGSGKIDAKCTIATSQQFQFGGESNNQHRWAGPTLLCRGRDSCCWPALCSSLFFTARRFQGSHWACPPRVVP